MSGSSTHQGKLKLVDFDMIRTLGTGSFGRVKYAKSKVDGQHYAVKFMKKHDIIKLKQGTFTFRT
jgi:protein kinase A